MSLSWGPINPPRDVNAGGIWLAEVVTVNGDGTVDVRNLRSRATRQRVPGLRGYSPAPGDRVIVADMHGDPQLPQVIGVQA